MHPSRRQVKFLSMSSDTVNLPMGEARNAARAWIRTNRLPGIRDLES